VYGAGRSRITHPFATLTQEQAPGIPFDLHVLSTPPAFILSQNRTLHKKLHEENQLNDSQNKKIDDRLIRKGASHKNLAAV
jgi:hypothetical protein